jgi:NAD(P)-dependent dehydrogenase (short-subunit alcohol dehydrogenase family)
MGLAGQGSNQDLAVRQILAVLVSSGELRSRDTHAAVEAHIDAAAAPFAGGGGLTAAAALAPGMAARGHGSIVSVSSMAGGVGLVGGAAYGATKASLEAMTRAWAAEYSASGVRVNAIAPGPVYTPTPSGPEFITSLGETTPMHRASRPEEIAEVVAFLASHEPATSPAPPSQPTADADRSSQGAKQCLTM